MINNGQSNGGGVVSEAARPGERLAVCTLHLPQVLNDGSPVEQTVLRTVASVLAQWFGGLSELGPCRGHWQDQLEAGIRFEIAVPPQRVHEVRLFAIIIGLRLDQRVMYFVERQATAHLVPVQQEGPHAFQ